MEACRYDKGLEVYYLSGILLVCDLLWSRESYYYKIPTLVNPTWNLNQPSETFSAAILFYFVL